MCSRRRCSPASVRANGTHSQTRCSPRCASALAATSRGANRLIPNQSQGTCRPVLQVGKPLDSTMSDRQPGQAPQTTQVLQCPPRRRAKPADPCVMVIFGATGDLTKRLLIPALYNLLRSNVLPENFA